MWYHYQINKGISLHSRVKLIRPPRRNHVISKRHKLLIINSSSKSYYLWPIQWCNLKFQSIIPYYKGISLNFKVIYLRVSTLKTVFCGVFGSILSYARLTSAGAIKSSNLWGAVLLFSISWYQQFDFLISRNTFPDITKCISLISRIQFLDIKKKYTFLDIKKSNFWYQEIDFLISRNVFWGAVLLLIQYFLISSIWFLDIKKPFLDIKKYNSWYQEI